MDAAGAWGEVEVRLTVEAVRCPLSSGECSNLNKELNFFHEGPVSEYSKTE